MMADAQGEARLHKLIHELQVHQMELEMQKDELIKSRNSAEILNNKYTDLFDFAPSPYFTLTQESAISDLNLKAAEFIGADRSSLKGKNFSAYIAAESLKPYSDFLQSVFVSNQTQSIEIKLLLKSEKPTIALVNGYARPGQNCLMNIIDLTQRIELQNELIKAKETAEEHNRLKTAFLQNISHEIRTPMNAIKGFSDLLIENLRNPARLEKFSKIINQRCNDLLDIINDILDIARIESGQSNVYRENCDLDLLFGELRTYFTDYQIKNNKEHIQLSIRNLKSVSIITDQTKLKQVLINLLTNAFKFTNFGKIEAGFQIVNDKIRFYVLDTGIGIPIEKQQEVFERFVQLKQDPSQAIHGTGLGLAIVKGLLQLLGGELHLESQPGTGSTFWFTIPYEKPMMEISAEKAQEKANKIDSSDSVLVVEDDDLNAEYIKEILSLTGLEVNYAKNGREAIQMALSTHVDLILLDIGLPDMNGYDAMSHIRKNKPQMKFIAQTAYASNEDSKKALAEGCVDYISKPFGQKSLLSVIFRHLNNK